MQFVRFQSKEYTRQTASIIQISQQHNGNDITCLCLFVTSPKSHASSEPSQELQEIFQMKSFSAVLRKLVFL